MNTLNETSMILATKIPHKNRHIIPGQLFGHDFPLRIEPTVFNIARGQAQNYSGGYWKFYSLSNDGFYMAPDADGTFHIKCPNFYQGELSSDAFGIAVCLIAYSYLSFCEDTRFARICATHFNLLRPFVAEHPEALKIYSAID